MQVSKISELLVMQHDMPVMAVSGVVDSVFERNTGTNAHGDWAIQNIVIKDGKDKIKVKVTDREALPMTIRGLKIYLCCTNTNSGWQGLKVKEDTYKGKTNKILSCTSAAEISYPDGVVSSPAQQQPAQTQPAPQQQPPATTQQKQTTAAPQTKTADSAPPATQTIVDAPKPKTAEELAADHFAKEQKNVAAFRGEVGRVVNAFKLIIPGIEHLAKARADAGKALSPEQQSGMVMSAFIKLDRAGMVSSLPTGDIDKYLPKKEDPKSAAAQ